jgi:sulfite exporter TauE/SafE
VDTALVVSALLMGLAGGPHCAAMCGAACSLVVGPRGAAPPLVALLAGRLAGYAAAGALAAAGVASLAALGAAAPLLRPVWGLVQVGACVLGLWLACTARAPGWLSSERAPLSSLANARPVRVFRSLPAPARAGFAGLCWVALPCGLLQSALLVSALASSPLRGATAMAAFAVTSALGLWLAPEFWRRLRHRADGERLASWSVRASGLLLAGASAFALWHGLGQALCVVPS